MRHLSLTNDENNHLWTKPALPQRLTKRQPHWLECPGCEGRLLLDIFHHIREKYPGLPGEGAYKLNGVSQHFLGQRKEDINYKQIPILQGGSADDRRSLAVYCLKVRNIKSFISHWLTKNMSRMFIFHSFCLESWIVLRMKSRRLGMQMCPAMFSGPSEPWKMLLSDAQMPSNNNMLLSMWTDWIKWCTGLLGFSLNVVLISNLS